MKMMVSFTADIEVVKEARKICKEKRMSLSAELNEMLKEFVKKNG